MPTANSWAAALSAPDDDPTPAKRKRAQSMGQLLMQRAGASEPVYGTGQGLAKVAAGAIGGYMERLDDDKERAGQKALANAILGIAGGSSSAGPAPSFGMGGGTSPTAGPPVAQGNDRADVASLKAALAPMESGGRYDIKGPMNAKYGAPLGKYQIMASNLPEWSQAALGRTVSQDEFLKNPELQEQIAGHRMGVILDKYGNLQDAASVWHSGRPLAQATAAGARDVNMSTADYVARTVGRRGGADVAAPDSAPVGMTAMGDQDGFTAAPGGFMIPPGPQAPPLAVAPPPAQQLPAPVPDGGTMLPGITVDGPTAQPLPPPRPADIGAAAPADAPAGGSQFAAQAPLPPPRPDFADMPAPGSAPAALQVTPDLSNTRDGGALSFATGVPTASNTGMPSLAAAVADPASSGAPAAPAPQRLAQLVAGGAPAPPAPVSNAGGAPSAMPASAGPGGNRGAALAAIISSPYASDGMKTWALGQINPKLEHVDLGDAVGLVGPNGQVVGRIAKTKAADFGVVGKDAYGNESYGYRNYGDQSVRPTSPASSAPPTDMNGAAVPAGVDPKVVRETQSKSYAGGTVPADAKDVSEVRKEVLSLPSYKNIKQASPVYRAMITTAGTDSKASDLNLIYGLGKIMDPNSVVREGELALANGTAGIEDRLVGFAKSVFGGARLTPETRAALLAEAHGRMKAYEDEYTVDADHYRGIAGRNRMNSDDVVPRFEAMKAWEPPAKPGAAPDRAAIEAEARRRGLVR